MRTLAAMACLSFAALSACTPNIVDGRILCAATAPQCPDGYVCANGRCYRNAPDAGADASAVSDVGDAFALTERCTPSALGARREDEDRDGTIDEGCALEVDIVHPITFALPNVASTQRDASLRFPRLSADGLTLTYCRMERLDEEVWQSTRTDAAARFGPAVHVPFVRMFAACAAQPHSIGYVYEGIRSMGSTTRRIYFLRNGSTYPEEISAAVSPTSASGASGHPYLSADGSELFFEGNRRVEGMFTMSDGLYVTKLVDAAWTPAMPVQFPSSADRPLRDMFPTLSADGLTLFFVRVVQSGMGTVTTPMVATRASLDVLAFSEPVAIADLADMPIGTFTVSLDRWEVFLSSDAPAATAGRLSASQRNEGLFRARLCAGACPARGPRDAQPCEGGVISADRLHCYSTDGVTRTHAASITHCGRSDASRLNILASVHSDPERELLRTLVVAPAGLWIGSQKATEGWAWSSGEPDTDNPGSPLYWAAGEPDSGGCASINPMGFGVSAACDSLRAAACEVDLWPSW